MFMSEHGLLYTNWSNCHHTIFVKACSSQIETKTVYVYFLKMHSNLEEIPRGQFRIIIYKYIKMAQNIV